MKIANYINLDIEFRQSTLQPITLKIVGVDGNYLGVATLHYRGTTLKQIRLENLKGKLSPTKEKMLKDFIQNRSDALLWVYSKYCQFETEVTLNFNLLQMVMS